MERTTETINPSNLRFDTLNWVATDSMPRDQEQSQRLHQPAYMHNSIDPITGRDILSLADHPSIDDGNLTIYFETEATRRTFMDTPFNHPFVRLPGKPSDDDDRGG